MAPKKETVKKDILKTLLILLIVFLLIIIGIITFGLFGNELLTKPDKAETVKRNVVVCDDSLVIPEYDEVMVNTASSHDVKMNSTWVFADGRSHSENAYVENPSTNVNAVYFDVKIAGSDEKIFTSPVLPVGSYMKNIAFDKVLSAGTYNGVLTYTLLGSDGETSIGTLQMTLKIIVQR